MSRRIISGSMKYRIHSRDYVARARKRLDDGSPESLFYAAFELRCAIGARMQQYLQEQEQVSKKKKKGWKIANLGKELERVFKTGDRIVEYKILDSETEELRYTFYYTPVSAELQKMGEKLGDYMHALKKYRAPEDTWWNDVRRFLESVYVKTVKANVGNMLGVPLIDPKTKKITFTSETKEGETPSDQIKAVGSVGDQMLTRVRYLDDLPGN